MTRVVLWVCLLGACDRVFGFDTVNAVDAPPADVPAGDLGACVAQSVKIATPGVAAVIAAAFDGPRPPELVVASSQGFVRSYRASGRAFTLDQDLTFDTMMSGLAAADVDGDQRLDLLSIGVPSKKVYVFSRQNGTFVPGTMFSVGALAGSLAVGDYDGDGAVDAVVSNAGDGNLTLARGNGAGAFQTSSISITAPGPIAPLVIDADRYADFAIAQPTQMSFGVLRGGLTPQLALQAAPTSSAGVACADFNEDTAGDIALASTGSPPSVLVAGGPLYTATRLVPVGSAPGPLVAVDLDGDHHMDLLVGTDTGLEILRGAGDGSFAAGDTVSGPRTVALAAADFDQDGVLDLAVASNDGFVTVVFRCR